MNRNTVIICTTEEERRYLLKWRQLSESDRKLIEMTTDLLLNPQKSRQEDSSNEQ